MVSRIDRKQVVDTALRLLNEVGLDGLTLRGIAKELNVQAPALYWHFKNKQELLDEMATEMVRRMAGSLEGAGPVRARRPAPGRRCSATAAARSAASCSPTATVARSSAAPG